MSGPGTRNFYTPAVAVQVYPAGTAELPALPGTTPITASSNSLATLAAAVISSVASTTALTSLTSWAMAAQQTTSTPVGVSTSSGAKTVTRISGKPDSYSASAPSLFLGSAVGRYARVYIQQDFSDASGVRTGLAWVSADTNPIFVMDCIVTDIVKIDADVEMTDASMMNMQWPITGDIIEIA